MIAMTFCIYRASQNSPEEVSCIELDLRIWRGKLTAKHATHVLLSSEVPEKIAFVNAELTELTNNKRPKEDWQHVALCNVSSAITPKGQQ